MRIEDEIKQKTFKSSHHRMAVNLIFTCHWLENKFAKRLKPHHLTPQQFNILRILRGQYPKPCRISLITERMLDKNSNASRLVEKLRKKGWVERQESKHDKRGVEIFITSEGLIFLEKMDLNESEWNESLHVLSSTEADLLSALLDKLRC